MAWVPERGEVLGEHAVDLGEAVGGDRAGVDETLRSGGDRGLEDVPRALDVDVARLRARLDHDEGEVDDDVGALDERLHRRAIEHVAAPVLGPLPAVRRGIERAPGHPDDALDLARALERADERPSEVARRAGDGDREAAH
jgi:hypothetical protein